MTNPQFWAEDGKVLFRDQLVYGWLAAITIPYRGFFPVLGRLVAGPASILPVPFAPLAYNLFAIALDSVCSALFFLPRYRRFMKSDLLRIVLCVLAVGAFDTSELAGTLINAMWYLELAGILWILLPPQIDARSRPVAAGALCLLGLIIGASAPMLIIGVPIVIYHLTVSFWRDGLISLSVAIGALAQTVFAFFSSRGLTLAHPGAKQFAVAMAGAFAYKVFVQAILGAGTAIKFASAKKAVAAIVVSALWIIYLIVRGGRWNVLIPVYFILSSLALPFVGRDEAQSFTSLATFDYRGERYFLLASCMFAYLVAYTLDQLLYSDVAKAAALLVIFAGGLWGNFRVEPFSDLDWQTNATRINAWVQSRRAGKPTPAVSVPINPPLWDKIELPSLEQQNPR